MGYVRSFVDFLGFLAFPSLKTIRDSKTALESLAKHFGSRVTSPVRDYKQPGVAVAKTETRLPSTRLVAYATDSGVVFECQFEARQQLHFSVNPTNWIETPQLHCDAAGMKLYVYLPDQPALIDQWLSGNETSLQGLALAADEWMDVFANSLWVAVRPVHAKPEFVDRLVAFTKSLPEELPTNAVDEIELMPPNLRPLAKWFKRWAIGDDVERRERIRTAPKAELRRLCRYVEPLLPEVDAYLDQLRGSSWPESAEKLLWLAETVAEIRATDATARFRH